MTIRMARRSALGAALVASLFLATGCENPTNPDVASVNGVDISRDAFLDEARIHAELPSDPYGMAADTNHSYATSGVAALLSQRILGEIVRAAAESYRVESDPDVVAQITQELATPDPDTGEVSPFNELPTDQRDALIEAIALQEALLNYVDANEWWNDDEAKVFDDIVADGDFPFTCVRHILVDTLDEANDIIAELDDGGDFEQLAAERSTDTESGASGGDLGCNPAGTFVTEFEAAIDGASAGDVVGPAETEFGYHIIRVDEPTIGAARTRGWVEVTRRTAKVQVDRRYGTWDPSTFSVLPPEGAQAPPSDGLNLEL